MQGFVPNATPWVDKTVQKSWHKLEQTGPDSAMPVLMPGETKSFQEYGCGHYGCVMPTQQPGILLKLTTDVSESEFVALILNDPTFRDVRLDGLVRYFAVVKLKGIQHRRRPVYAIWREAAHSVGFAAAYRGPRWSRELMKFKDRSHVLQVYLRPGKPGFEVRREKVLALREYGRRYAEQVYDEGWPKWLKNPEKSALALQLALYSAQSMASSPEIYHVGETLWDLIEVGVLLADVHLQNVGKVKREHYSEDVVVITDPGHMVPLDPDLTIPPIAEI